MNENDKKLFEDWAKELENWVLVASAEEVIQPDETEPAAKFRITVLQNMPTQDASYRDSVVTGERVWRGKNFALRISLDSDRDVKLAIKRVAAEIKCSPFLARECIAKLPPREHPPSRFLKIDRWHSPARRASPGVTHARNTLRARRRPHAPAIPV